MSVNRKAPEVIWDYPKGIINDIWGEHYTNYPNNFLYFCLSELDPNEFKVFMFLTTVAYGGFKLHKTTALQRTGMKQTAYYEARKKLEEKGWIVLTEDKEPLLVIKTKNIRTQYMKHLKEPEVREVIDEARAETNEFIF